MWFRAYDGDGDGSNASGSSAGGGDGEPFNPLLLSQSTAVSDTPAPRGPLRTVAFGEVVEPTLLSTVSGAVSGVFRASPFGPAVEEESPRDWVRSVTIRRLRDRSGCESVPSVWWWWRSVERGGGWGAVA